MRRQEPRLGARLAIDQEYITQRQRHLPEIDWREQVSPTQWKSYMRHMCWWRLEAMRGYPSSARSLEYARSMRWAAEHAREKPGTWQEICARVGYRPGGPGTLVEFMEGA